MAGVVVGLVDDQDHGWTRYVGDGVGSAVSSFGVSSERRTPVSYTHLDVYKRQGQRRDDADGAHHLLFGELVSDQTEGQGNDTATDTLNDAGHDHQGLSLIHI